MLSLSASSRPLPGDDTRRGHCGGRRDRRRGDRRRGDRGRRWPTACRGRRRCRRGGRRRARRRGRRRGRGRRHCRRRASRRGRRRGRRGGRRRGRQRGRQRGRAAAAATAAAAAAAPEGRGYQQHRRYYKQDGRDGRHRQDHFISSILHFYLLWPLLATS